MWRSQLRRKEPGRRSEPVGGRMPDDWCFARGQRAACLHEGSKESNLVGSKRLGWLDRLIVGIGYIPRCLGVLVRGHCFPRTERAPDPRRPTQIARSQYCLRRQISTLDSDHHGNNMNRLIEFALDPTGQAMILVETGDAMPPQGQVRVSVGGAMAEKAAQTFDAALMGIKPIADAVRRQLTTAIADADEIAVEFGIKLTANAGVVVAATSAEGNCKISIKWARRL